jgi:hypothetical protein
MISTSTTIAVFAITIPAALTGLMMYNIVIEPPGYVPPKVM